MNYVQLIIKSPIVVIVLTYSNPGKNKTISFLHTWSLHRLIDTSLDFHLRSFYLRPEDSEEPKRSHSQMKVETVRSVFDP